MLLILDSVFDYVKSWWPTSEELRQELQNGRLRLIKKGGGMEAEQHLVHSKIKVTHLSMQPRFTFYEQ